MLVILATAPLWSSIGATLILKEKPSVGTWLISIVALFGVLLVVWPNLETGINLSDGVALLAA